ncbi:MAG: hypothetical protein Q8L75_01770 [Acidobacteriota bacterium]|nr:hypothetical protein [Acidobacteriota bacterium]
MADRKPTGNTKSKTATEAKVVELAEQLGWFLGTAKAKADGWLESDKVKKELARIRDGASELLQHIEAAARSASMDKAGPKASPKTGPKADKQGPVVAGPDARKVAKDAKPDRGPVDAPGKRHRKPPPQERIDKRMGEPEGKQMGQKQFRPGQARGRG